LPGVELKVSGTQARDFLLTIAVTATSRVCIVRDRLLRRIQWDGRLQTAGPGTSRHSIRSGKSVLDAVLVQPQPGAARAVLLICHGIGETVELWHPVQQLLAENGVASLVFDYAGYGRSPGLFNSRKAEQAAFAAFHFLEQEMAPMPVSVLGLSLGSGIAAAVFGRVPAHRLVLCAAFTSLRKAAGRVGVPKAFWPAVPSIWNTEDALRSCSIPVLIVHGEMDRLFPVRMAEELAGICASDCELAIVRGASHNDPFYHPQQAYWGDIVARFLVQDC
jgi:pimeloyl-ACP methyl ester carboxylesterase